VAGPHQLPAVVVALPAEIDMANAGRVGQQLGSAFAPSIKTVITDVTATRFCDSSGISMLVRACTQAAANRTTLRLVAPAAAVLRATPKTPTRSPSACPLRPLPPSSTPTPPFNSLFFGLGAVALLVGAVGVANIMVISVLERRSEIGLRRALGATKGHIRTQFLAESILLTHTGGLAGVLAGAAATAIFGPRQT
jgi:anti-anti-sigma factor